MQNNLDYFMCRSTDRIFKHALVSLFLGEKLEIFYKDAMYASSISLKSI